MYWTPINPTTIDYESYRVDRARSIVDQALEVGYVFDDWPLSCIVEFEEVVADLPTNKSWRMLIPDIETPEKGDWYGYHGTQSGRLCYGVLPTSMLEADMKLFRNMLFLREFEPSKMRVRKWNCGHRRFEPQTHCGVCSSLYPYKPRVED